ncbi:MAG: glycosidase, partial [Bacteroidetes bacterium]|nr:glycosidase [Bacteroidota bacterium]
MTLIRNASARLVTCVIPALAVVLFLLFPPASAYGQTARIEIVKDASGSRLQVDGRDFMVLGMNWDYFPIGKNYAYSLWTQPDDIIEAALAREMPLLKNMGVNTIRQYVGVPPRWVRYIYEHYGIHTVLNHALGRYGVTVDGVYVQPTDYSDARTREVLLAEISALVEEFRGVPGVLMWLLGNENNYGLEWSSAETESLPEGEQQAAKARYLYSLMGEAARVIKQYDTNRPVAIANGDLQYIDIIAAEAKDIDVFGTNVYRGISFGDAFRRVKDILGVPIMYTEFGADAFDAKHMREDQYTQAKYLLGQWQEIYENAAGKGKAGNAIGGLTFQFSDGWWKFRQESNLDVHDINASWANDAYPEDYVPGQNNMNEEWWGICAKGPTDARGLYNLYPRAAYYALQKAHALDPYSPGTTPEVIARHFASIQPVAAVLEAHGDRGAYLAEELQRLRVSGVRIEMSTYSTGGSNVSTPDAAASGATDRPAFLGFDHMESFYAEVEARPADNVTGTVSFNVLGHVPVNPIDELFYEDRGRARTVTVDGQPEQMNDLERVKVYRAQVSWDDHWFHLDGFYRTGHYHWGYEGDFFGLYQEANYGPNIDIYNGEAPLGMEITGKQALDGLKIALGPELWWGANPAVLLKYQRELGPVKATGIYQEDLDEHGMAVSSFAVPLPPTRKATLHLATKTGPVGIELGGIWSGDTKNGELFQIVEGESGSYRVLQDRINADDAFGGKAKLTVSSGRWNWYLQGSARGIVADGGPTSALTFTGWHLKDNGIGNQWNLLTGLAVNLGNFQIAPNVLWQKPVVGPIPGDVPAPGRPRNVLDDPFAVRANRETTAGELLVTYDPTPATWMYAWDSDIREDAPFAASVGFIFRHHPTTQDAAIGILADRTMFAFPGAPPARDLWESYARIVSKLGPGLGMIANLYAGTGEPNGVDDRLIHRYGGDVRLAMGSTKLNLMAKINDWGPYDYHRDFNLTFPLQLT